MLNYKPIAILVVLTSLLAGCSSNSQQQSGQSQVPNQAQGQARVTSTPLPTRVVVAESSITADGQLTLTAPIITVGFEQAGKVVSVSVSLGQSVKKGDLLGTVDDTSLQDSVIDAQLSLDSLVATIAQSTAPASKEDIAAAEAALNSAYVSYNTTKAGSTAEQIATAKQNVDSAWRSYLSTQIQRDKACAPIAGASQTNSMGCQSGEASLGNAYESWAAARDNYAKVTDPVSQDTLTQAYTSVVSAKAKVDSLMAGVTEAQQKIYDAQISQAKAALERAKSNLSKAKLYSPCDCIVNDVNVAEGVVASSQAFQLVNLSDMKFLTTNLVETNIEKVKVGAAVSIRMKAYTETLTGTVSTILSMSTNTLSNGTAVYTVLIDVPTVGKTLLPGMTGQADISIK
jgi:multidrug resistance efflux pump